MTEAALLARLPARLTTSEVCALARISKRTLQRRLKAGVYVLEPIDRGRELLFRRDDVIGALGLTDLPSSPPTAEEPPRVSADRIRAARAAMTRRRNGPGRQ